MHHLSRTVADPVPLDFNLPRRTDSVADALGPDLRPNDRSLPAVPDAAALLGRIGLPAHTVRDIVSERSTQAV